MKTKFSNLILASSSKYKIKSLETLGIPFTSSNPSIDETPISGESPEFLSLRLASDKATSIAAKNPEAIVIGADQVAACKGQIIGKPGSTNEAIKQLSFLQNKDAHFFTSVSLFSNGLKPKSQCAHSHVRFRKLSKAQIKRYVAIDQPIDCAGSFKSEALGISLFEYIKSDDPTALVGLPLIFLTTLLIESGITPIEHPNQFVAR